MSYSPNMRHYSFFVAWFLGVRYNEWEIKKNAMRHINIQKIIYHVRHRYLTLNNVVILVAFVIAAGWVWASLGAMQRNYGLQKDIDLKKRQLQLTQLQRDNLSLQRNYYQTTEYQELAVRDTLGYVRPGEHALVLPPNSAAAIKQDAVTTTPVTAQTTTSNIEQWVNFLFGGYSRRISGGK
jgi:cell division protein FtsB